MSTVLNEIRSKAATNVIGDASFDPGYRKLGDWYSKIEKLSSGAYGVVYKGKDLRSGSHVAIKKLIDRKLTHANSEGIAATTIREMSLCKQVHDHINIVKLLDVLIHEEVYFVFELCDNDLYNHIRDDKHFRSGVPRLVAKNYLWQILSGLDHCHARGVMHRDLKTQNILVGKDEQLKIADFGISRAVMLPIQQRLTHEVVTQWYRAPEVFLGGRRGSYSYSLDMFSIGCIFFEIVTRNILFRTSTDLEHIRAIFAVNGTPTPQTWPGLEKLEMYQKAPGLFVNSQSKRCYIHSNAPMLCGTGIDLLRRLISTCPDARPTAKLALEHHYFAELEDEGPGSCTVHDSTEGASNTARQLVLEANDAVCVAALEAAEALNN